MKSASSQVPAYCFSEASLFLMFATQGPDWVFRLPSQTHLITAYLPILTRTLRIVAVVTQVPIVSWFALAGVIERPRFLLFCGYSCAATFILGDSILGLEWFLNVPFGLLLMGIYAGLYRAVALIRKRVEA